MKRKFLITALAAALAVGVQCSAQEKEQPVAKTVPLYGNAYRTAPGVVSVYFHLAVAGELSVALEGGSAQGGAAGSGVEARVGGRTFDAEAGGKVEIEKPGYVKVDLVGLPTGGRNIGEGLALRLGGEAAGGKVTFVPTEPASANWPYWGRRGPSVHCKYDVGGAENIRWFYNELTIPEGQDPPGIYAMANGFDGGYMGIQVAANGERRVLFSVWSTYVTDRPSEIPAEYQVRKVRQGEGVTVQEFGNEGSGGQSFLPYEWEAGKRYGFLTEAVYDAKTNSTTFTGYFRGHDGEWRLVAALKQPHPEAKSYRNAHSFLENFLPEEGWKQQQANFDNQWVCTADGQWREVTEAVFTNDATAREGIRLDYAGWGDGKGFWLQNCGFFDDNTAFGTRMERTNGKGTPPEVDFGELVGL